ncbi:Protein P200 [Colletotrichum trifolii]|uniref:Protein P200 n=1 Tax=Colletotrichum trifolii TaxID=5466 RepID=A0A4R8REP2_COLTR|nr:Protein P200 [Colletotrichum trifolii]
MPATKRLRSSEKGGSPPARRSRRLQQDGNPLDAVELPPTKRRRRSQDLSDNEVEDDRSIPVEQPRTQKTAKPSPRVEMLRRVADNTRRLNDRSTIEVAGEAVKKPGRRRSRKSTVLSGKDAELPLEPAPAPKSEPELEMEPEPEAEAESEPETSPEPEPGHELEMELEPEAEAESEPEPDAEPEPEAESEPESEPESEARSEIEVLPSPEPEDAVDVYDVPLSPGEVGWTDSQRAFPPPQAADRVEEENEPSVPRADAADDSTGLYDDPTIHGALAQQEDEGWTNKAILSTVNASSTQLRSKRGQGIWEHLTLLKRFWEQMPRAPDFNQQTEYLHNHEDAEKARQSIRAVDRFVEESVHGANKAAPGIEAMMPPKPATVDLYSQIIPVLVYTLKSVFKRGVTTDKSPWRGIFNRLNVQIMQRLLAWVEQLYGVMLKGLERRPRDQLGSQKISRGKLRPYVAELKAELDMVLEEIVAAPRRLQEQRERARYIREQREKFRQEEDERRRQQREFVNSQITQRLTSAATNPEEPPEEPQGDRKWTDDEYANLLRKLLREPKTDLKVFAWQCQRTMDDVRGMVEVLKQCCREQAAAQNREVPEFARDAVGEERS